MRSQRGDGSTFQASAESVSRWSITSLNQRNLLDWSSLSFLSIRTIHLQFCAVSDVIIISVLLSAWLGRPEQSDSSCVMCGYCMFIVILQVFQETHCTFMVWQLASLFLTSHLLVHIFFFFCPVECRYSALGGPIIVITLPKQTRATCSQEDGVCCSNCPQRTWAWGLHTVAAMMALWLHPGWTFVWLIKK